MLRYNLQFFLLCHGRLGISKDIWPWSEVNSPSLPQTFIETVDTFQARRRSDHYTNSITKPTRLLSCQLFFVLWNTIST